MEFNPNASVADALRMLQTEKLRAEVQLHGGHTLTGSVGAIGNHFVVLSSLTSREYYDALVRIEDIAAVVARARKE